LEFNLEGISLNAQTYVEGYTVVLIEKTVVSTQNVTLTHEQAAQALYSYKTLEIKYQAPLGTKTIQCPLETIADDWSWDWNASWCQLIPIAYRNGNVKIFASVMEELNLHGHISIGTIYEAWMKFGLIQRLYFNFPEHMNLKRNLSGPLQNIISIYSAFQLKQALTSV